MYYVENCLFGSTKIWPFLGPEDPNNPPADPAAVSPDQPKEEALPAPVNEGSPPSGQAENPQSGEDNIPPPGENDAQAPEVKVDVPAVIPDLEAPVANPLHGMFPRQMFVLDLDEKGVRMRTKGDYTDRKTGRRIKE